MKHLNTMKALTGHVSNFTFFSAPDMAAPNLSVLTDTYQNLGIEVHQGLYRSGCFPRLAIESSARERCLNGIIHWRPVPPDFVFDPSRPIERFNQLPLYPLNASIQQRFIMMKSRFSVEGRENSGFHIQGGGITLPLTLFDGRPQLQIAGIANIIDGFGDFRNCAGLFVLNGYFQPPNSLFYNVIVRLANHQKRDLNSSAQDCQIDLSSPSINSRSGLSFTLIGESRLDSVMRADGSIEIQKTQDVHLFHTLPRNGTLPDRIQRGPSMGVMKERIWLDPSAPALPYPYIAQKAEFHWTGRRGEGKLFMESIDGRAFTMDLPRTPSSTFGAGGIACVSQGTGFFEGMGGIVSSNSIFNHSSKLSSTIYDIQLLRLADSRK